jgi:hypothetical protein
MNRAISSSWLKQTTLMGVLLKPELLSADQGSNSIVMKKIQGQIAVDDRILLYLNYYFNRCYIINV